MVKSHKIFYLDVSLQNSQYSFIIINDGGHPATRALDKREYLVIIRDNFCSFYIKTYGVTIHLNRLDETVQLRSHNIWFDEK